MAKPSRQHGSPMKMHLDDASGAHRITGYGAGYVSVDERRVTRSLIVSPRDLILDWPPRRLEELDAACLQAVVDLAPAIALLGTGARQQFPDPELLAPLMDKGMGIEVMATDAACRTYNILAAEGRSVAAMLLIAQEQD